MINPNIYVGEVCEKGIGFSPEHSKRLQIAKKNAIIRSDLLH